MCWLFASTLQARECHEPVSTENLSPASKNILFALSGVMPEQQRQSLLRELVKSAISEMEDEALPLRWRAHLVYAAQLLQQQDYASARQHLKQIPLKSSAAVPAALLMAESWRLQGDLQQATGWFIRVGRQYPYNIEALEGLLAAAGALEQEDQGGQAAALYETVTRHANDAASAIAALATTDDMTLGALISQQGLLPGDLQTQLVRRVLTATDFDVLGAHHNSSAAGSRGRCLLMQLHAYQRQTESTRQMLEGARSSLAIIDDGLMALAARESALTEALTANDYSATQLAIRQELRSISNQSRRDQLQRQAIAANLATLPALVSAMEKQLDTMVARSQSRTTLMDELLADTVDQAASSLYVELANVAAEAALRRADLLESRLMLRKRDIKADESARRRE